MGFTRETIAHLWDVLHYVVQVREIREVTFIWYRMKFSPDTSAKTAARGWERFKKMLVDLKIPHEKIQVEDEAGAASSRVAIKFKLPEAWNMVEDMLDDGRQPDEDESQWVSREERQHNQGCGAHRGDHALLRQGAERDGHVPLRQVDTRKRTG